MKVRVKREDLEKAFGGSFYYAYAGAIGSKTQRGIKDVVQEFEPCPKEIELDAEPIDPPTGIQWKRFEEEEPERERGVLFATNNAWTSGVYIGRDDGYTHWAYVDLPPVLAAPERVKEEKLQAIKGGATFEPGLGTAVRPNQEKPQAIKDEPEYRPEPYRIYDHLEHGTPQKTLQREVNHEFDNIYEILRGIGK